MKKKVFALVIVLTIMITACSSGGNGRSISSSGSDDGHIEDTGEANTPETTVTETTEEATVAEQDGPIRDGDRVTFGHYRRGETEPNPIPIEWMVVSEENGKMLLVSKYSLEYMPYNTEDKDVTWENCSLRKWLNEEFINEAFNASEQNYILTVTNSNPKSYYGTKGGNDTEDRVFLLSTKEVESLEKKGIKIQGAICWLRSPGDCPSNAAIITLSGDVKESGENVSIGLNVRPALWIKI